MRPKLRPADHRPPADPAVPHPLPSARGCGFQPRGSPVGLLRIPPPSARPAEEPGLAERAECLQIGEANVAPSCEVPPVETLRQVIPTRHRIDQGQTGAAKASRDLDHGSRLADAWLVGLSAYLRIVPRAKDSRMRLLGTSERDTRRFASATGISALSYIEQRSSETAANTSVRLM